MTQCALVEKTCQIGKTFSAPLLSIRGWRFGREVHLGSGDVQQSLAEKALFDASRQIYT